MSLFQPDNAGAEGGDERAALLESELRRVYNENQEDDSQPAISFERYVQMLAELDDDCGAREYLTLQRRPS